MKEQSHFSGDRLRAARGSAGFSATELAAKIDKSTYTIAGYEAGRIDPPAAMVGKLADALDVPVDRLFERLEVAI